MLFLRDSGGRLHHRSASSQRLERAARSSYGFASLVTCCQFAAISAGPTDDEQGSGAAFEKAGLERFPAAAHVIAPVTDLRTLLVPSFRLSPVDWTPSVASVYLVCG